MLLTKTPLVGSLAVRAASCHICASKHTTKRVPFKRIAGFEILVEHIVALVAAKPLELGRMHALVHPGRHGAAFEAVAGDHVPIVAGRGGAPLDDPRDRTAVERIRADDGRGQGAIAFAPWAAPKSGGTARPR